mmetsp:Transcript_39448/g.63202  ORF Transcript_39448/g.63202 Transcript_39448/m.63202 type:complete len:129 (-) Transcript_39448:90-476(-)
MGILGRPPQVLQSEERLPSGTDWQSRRIREAQQELLRPSQMGSRVRGCNARSSHRKLQGFEKCLSTALRLLRFCVGFMSQLDSPYAPAAAITRLAVFDLYAWLRISGLCQRPTALCVSSEHVCALDTY